MPDPMRIDPHPYEQRSLAELREEFRAQNLERVRSLLADYRINGVKMKLMGLPIALSSELECTRNGIPEALKPGTPEHRAAILQFALDSRGGQDFGLDDVPPSLIEDLNDLALECAKFEQVTWADTCDGVADHDAPPTEKPMHEMSEPELLAYVDDAIARSKENQ